MSHEIFNQNIRSHTFQTVQPILYIFKINIVFILKTIEKIAYGNTGTRSIQLSLYKHNRTQQIYIKSHQKETGLLLLISAAHSVWFVVLFKLYNTPHLYLISLKLHFSRRCQSRFSLYYLRARSAFRVLRKQKLLIHITIFRV